jgi:2-keto-4-pentenoate hydratase
MLKKYTIAQLAKQLYDAQVNRAPIDPLSEMEPDISVHEAYEVQLENVNKVVDAGLQISGKKIGVTSLAMQKMLGVFEPDYGHLFTTMDVSEGKIDMNTLLQPLVEGEIAFILKEDLQGPDVTPKEVLESTEFIVAAIEIVDSRVRDWKIKLVDTIADNASAGCYVLGQKLVPPSDIILPEVEMTLYKNEEEVSSGTGADVMGDPALCVAWLANKLWEYNITLKKGEVILSGALSAATPAKPGDVFRIELTGLGTVEAEFLSKEGSA